MFRSIDDVDTRILSSIEIGMRGYEFVPVEEVLRRTKLPQNDLDFRLSILFRKELAKRWVGPYKGVSLTELGYDCLAFHSLVKDNTLEAIGPPVGVGKESPPSQT